MKILFINPIIRENELPYNFPIGLGIIAAIMRKQGHDVYVYDQNGTRTSTQQMLQNLRKFKEIDVVATGGLITVYDALKKNIPALRELFPRSKFVIGGGVTVEPEMIFRHMDVDFCVHGEGEVTFPALCDAFENNAKTYDHIDGISYFDKGICITTQQRHVEKNLDLFPMPAYDLFPSEIYFANNPLKRRMNFDTGKQRCATIMWSRGCPYNCSFCWRMMGVGTRFRSPDLLIDEIRYLRSNYGVDSYIFVDECINANKKKAAVFARSLIDNKLDAPWYSAARINLFDQEIARLFKESGCVGLNFGIESASPKILKIMNKRADPKRASEAIQLAHKVGIMPVCTFIIGMPGETRQTIRDSVHWVKKNKVKRAAFFFITPFPGCALYNTQFVMDRILEKFGTKDKFFSAIGNVTDFCVNLTHLSDSELIALHRKARLQVSLFAGYQWIRLLKEPRKWYSSLKKLEAILK